MCIVEGCESRAKARGLCGKHYHRLQRYGDPKGGAKYWLGDQDEFIREASKAQTDECILWPFPLSNKGYGLKGSGGNRSAHRQSCEMAHGSPPSSSHHAAHSCGNRSCVNPRHLRWATPSENSMDKAGHGTMLIGEKNHQSKLTRDQVVELITRDGSMLLKDVAEKYGISIATASKIRRGESWSWVQRDLQHK